MFQLRFRGTPEIMESSSCYMCGQQSEKLFFISEPGRSEPELSISCIICQHFWFQEDALQTANICEPCWNKVDQFHRFYEDVRKHHEQFSEPNSIFIKQEETEFEVEIEKTNVETEVLFDEETKVDITEECNQLAIEADQVVEKPTGSKIARNRKLSSAPKKPLKGRSSHGQVVETLSKKEIQQNQIMLSAKKKQMEDSFIQQHLPYNCVECSTKFESFVSIRRHMADLHARTYIICCGVQYSNRNMLYQHVQAVLNPEAFKCELCDKSYTLHIGYIRHKERCHPDESPFPCDKCWKRFPSQFLLDRHIAGHRKVKEKPTCEICGKCFKSKETLKDHMNSIHEKKAVYVCEICSAPFARQWMFKEHQMTHEYTAEELKRQCTICKRWLKNERLWKKHMSRHKGEGAHKCDHCDLVSINSNALKLHIERRHRKNQKYVCDLCGKVYTRAVTLNEHVANAHTGTPLYQCQFCDRKFFSNASMYAHRKKAHPKEWQEWKTARYGIEQATDEKDEGLIYEYYFFLSSSS
ncbi:transcription factor grauzone-like isoform X2 [Aedes albopictus]|uniref:C2H2-type domain-containing protein n=1 Tax=Aedes albopictus TaxID=7160 RepID=A0ABM1ZAF2_AEDAL